MTMRLNGADILGNEAADIFSFIKLSEDCSLNRSMKY
jgi:hypothetical protein